MDVKIAMFFVFSVLQIFHFGLVEGSSKMNVALKFSPKKDNQGTLIRVRGSGIRENFEEWSKILTDYLSTYYTPRMTSRMCDYQDRPSTNYKDSVCYVPMHFGDCNKENDYGYRRIQPCIFLEFEKKNDWVPEFYNNTDDLPSEMPEDLKNYIKNEVKQPEKLNNVWVSCSGKQAVDVEFLGPVRYFPSIRGFPGYYYPSSESNEYLSPLVAVQFQRAATGIILNVECRAWAKNLNYVYDKSGSVHFELLIDS